MKGLGDYNMTQKILSKIIEKCSNDYNLEQLLLQVFIEESHNDLMSRYKEYYKTQINKYLERKKNNEIL